MTELIRHFDIIYGYSSEYFGYFTIFNPSAGYVDYKSMGLTFDDFLVYGFKLDDINIIDQLIKN
jgi:hypothetical protein